MKTLLLLTFVLAFASLTFAQDDAAIKKAIDAQYTKLSEAHERKDLKAILALKTADFHTILPDGRVTDAKFMADYSRTWLERNQPPFNIRFTIEKLTVSPNSTIAVADVFQQATRYQDLAGKRRKVDTGVRQRETWSLTSDGWKLKSVDNVHDATKSVDGVPVDPTKPFDPAAPPFKPAT
jgi:hypothetical protein